jgi:hypothetical protein
METAKHRPIRRHRLAERETRHTTIRAIVTALGIVQTAFERRQSRLATHKRFVLDSFWYESGADRGWGFELKAPPTGAAQTTGERARTYQHAGLCKRRMMLRARHQVLGGTALRHFR